MQTFAITSMGRSGTRFLASILHSSFDWIVKHEPYDGFQTTEEVQARFNSFAGYFQYGEVNSFLRGNILELVTDYKAIILRDPLQIFQSMYNRKKPRLRHLIESLHQLDVAIGKGIPTIAFSQMIVNRDYLQQVALNAGVCLDQTPNLTPKNTSLHYAMPPKLLGEAQQKLQWFTDKYRSLW